MNESDTGSANAMKPYTGCKVAIFDPAGRVLILRRSATDDRRAGEWDMPGGGVEIGEDIGAGAVRETLEEAGITIKVGRLTPVYAGTTAHPDRGLSITRVLFIAKLPNGTTVKLSHEHDLYRWVTLQEAIDLFPHPFYNEGLVYARKQGLID